MTKYIDAERLKTEIQHLKIDVYDEAHQFDIGARSSLTFLESFIDSLQQEQQEVNLEKEIDVCWQNWLSPSNQKEVEGVLPKTEFAMYVRHFYELGLNARKEEKK